MYFSCTRRALEWLRPLAPIVNGDHSPERGRHETGAVHMAEVASGEGVTAESALGEVISPRYRCAKPLTDEHYEIDDYKD